MPESDQVAVYFLFGESDDGEQLKVYIGQTGDLRARLTKHHKEKEFWDRALVLISRTNTLTQTHALFLEWHCLQAARSAGRYADENGNGGSKPHTPPPLLADCIEIFETGQILLSSLGHPLFQSVAKPALTNEADEVFLCKGSGTDGRGLYTSEGFVVLKGSVGRFENVKSIIGTGSALAREKLLSQGVMRKEGDTVVFEKDHLFRTPSAAAIALMGRTANGWLEWRTAGDVTLDQAKRQLPPQ
jgi:predicted GIY-YIG superfamily endonuclease